MLVVLNGTSMSAVASAGIQSSVSARVLNENLAQDDRWEKYKQKLHAYNSLSFTSFGETAVLNSYQTV